jgi:multidrug efflux pump subunit AcrB
LQNTPVEVPVEIRISAQADADSQHSAEDVRTLRAIASDVERVFAGIPIAKRVRGDWFPETSKINLSVDPDRANLAGISNLDVATSSTTAISGSMVTTLREGNKDIPVVARLRMEERSQLSDIESLYAYSSTETQRVPLVLISNFNVVMDTERIRRLEHFRTISVRGFPAPGYLPSQVLKAAMPGITSIKNSLPPGYALQIGGDDAKQKDGFGDLVIALSVSVFAIFLALVMQFNHAVKPLLVFAAVPFGVVGAVAALFAMHTPFGFMAFLGITSLVGVIVSHVIVLFDFIEEMHERGEPLEQALADAGIVRLRPVLITVGATVLALFPLALHGGPLWKPLCYAQIGGLFAATFITLLLVPVLYAIFVLDLRVVKWQGVRQALTKPVKLNREVGSTGLVE